MGALHSRSKCGEGGGVGGRGLGRERTRARGGLERLVPVACFDFFRVVVLVRGYASASLRVVSAVPLERDLMTQCFVDMVCDEVTLLGHGEVDPVCFSATRNHGDLAKSCLS